MKGSKNDRLMPRYILKIHDGKFNQDYYMEWSTVVDAPISYGGTLEEFQEYYKEKYGNQGMKDLPSRMERVEATGSSCHFDTNGIDHYFNYNTAGENGTTLTKEEILEEYCRHWREMSSA